MRPHLTMITLAVADLDRALAFYRQGLGLPSTGIMGQEFEHGRVAFFDLHGGLKLAIWAQKDLAFDTGLPPDPISPTAMSLGHNVQTKPEVDEILTQAIAAGATLVKAAHPTFYGGYAGYFTDPDGHLWEIAWNPDFPPP